MASFFCTDKRRNKSRHLTCIDPTLKSSRFARLSLCLKHLAGIMGRSPTKVAKKNQKSRRGASFSGERVVGKREALTPP